MLSNAIMECVPNFSEGRNKVIIEEIVGCFRGKEGVKLLDYSSDADHNRTVVTAAGEPETLAEAVVEAVGAAVRLIDLRKHSGGHPRIGAVDVIPFVPVRGCTAEQAIELSKRVAREVWKRFGLPVYLYEKSASSPARANLADVRRGQFEGLAEKMKLPEWEPDFGERKPHPTAGAAACGARDFLCAFNVNLNTPELAVAQAVAKRVRQSGGGLAHCKAIGVMLESRNLAQVSMNLTDLTVTGLRQAFERVRTEALKYGAAPLSSEVIGLLPARAFADAAAHYLMIENYSPSAILESKLLE